MLFLYNPWPILIWIGLAWVIGMLGSRKRFRFLGNFLISLLFSPLVGIVVLLASDDRRPERAAKK
ncbi:hypothetical protein [Labrenzia sp. PHM005]|uniref:hypothetical protein n=1 Tax=Labrenzia sp. PHM005 TaxID=2590016 RepID=UPI0011407FFC|nr:hypothetical protein [Labrenzia sp. PHM005]QDG75021.1 hypothetical protein FJ695_03565 [Labrenzia sp. PHM005]